MKYLILLLVAFNVFACAARADFVSGATGHTTFKLGETTAPGILNFAVLNRKNGQFGDEWGGRLDNFDQRFFRGEDALGRLSPPLDFTAHYLYLYQLVNDTASTNVHEFRIPVLQSQGTTSPLVTSWGQFEGTGFADDKKMIGTAVPVSATNFFGFTDPASPPGSPSLKVINPRIVLINSNDDPGIDPAKVYFFGSVFIGSWFDGSKVTLTPKRRGTLCGFTSHYPPMLLPGSVVFRCGGPGESPCS